MSYVLNGTLIGESYTELSNALKLTTPSGAYIDRNYSELIDPNQYVGWASISDWNPLVRQLFCKHTINVIRQKTSEYLVGVNPQGKKIIPSDRVVVGALYSIFQNYKPKTGDIYGKFLVVDETQRDDYSNIVDQTISLLVRGITTDIEMSTDNEEKTIWTTVLGDFNERGLRSHPVIKMREKRPDPMLFHMRY